MEAHPPAFPLARWHAREHVRADGVAKLGFDPPPARVHCRVYVPRQESVKTMMEEVERAQREPEAREMERAAQAGLMRLDLGGLGSACAHAREFTRAGRPVGLI